MMQKRKYTLPRAALIVLALLADRPPAPARQPPPQKFELTVDSIMRGPDLVGYVPADVRWSQDGRRVYFRWKRAGEPRLKEPDTYVVERDGRLPRKLTEEEAKQAPPASGDLSKDRRFTTFTEEGDVFLYDHARGERRQVTRTADAETNPRFTRDQKGISFTRQNNLYVLALDGGALAQLTDIRIGGEQAGAARGTESQEWLKREERGLIEAVRERAARREEQEAKRKLRESRRPFHVPAGRSVANLSLSPDGKYVVATIVEPATGAKNTIVPSYVTESAYTEDIPGRPKVGDAQGRTRMAVIAVETGEAKWIDHGQRVEVAPRVRARAEAEAAPEVRSGSGVEPERDGAGQAARREQAGQKQDPPRDERQQTESAAQPHEREVQLSPVQWSEDGARAALLARAADNKERWVLLLDPSTGKTRALAGARDDAWVGGPGLFTLGWLPDNRRVYFQSELDGYAHLYTVAADGGAPAQLTSGPFEVSEVRLSPDRTKFYFTSSEGGPAERHLYSTALDGGARTRLTSLPGNNDATVSPDEQTLAIVRSYSNRPPELYLAANRADAPARQVTTSPLPEFFTYDWIDPPIVRFKARDGALVHARLYKPARGAQGGPAVVFVHGAGYLQNVHRWWSNYYREYMFHHLLMERGYTVIDVDYRGSAGYGRDWRTGIYRRMGGKDLDDQVDAVRYLVSEHGIDPSRVGIYGGSYGGFVTFMAMFTRPEVFAAGAALRPVSDWAHYNHPYTSNILNLPQADADAYRRSSPIYFAEGLRGALLICHGMVDTNVHFQDTVRLVQRLIELRKENWELAVYPVEGHAFEYASSWADEYKRILKLFDTNLRPRPPARAQ